MKEIIWHLSFFYWLIRLALYTLAPSMSLQMARFHSFLWMSNIQLYMSICHIFIHSSMNIWALSIVWLFFKVFLLILRERNRTRKGRREKENWRGRDRGREREFQASSTQSVQSWMQISNSQTVRSCPKLKSRVGCLTDQATQVPP